MKFDWTIQGYAEDLFSSHFFCHDTSLILAVEKIKHLEVTITLLMTRIKSYPKQLHHLIFTDGIFDTKVSLHYRYDRR